MSLVLRIEYRHDEVLDIPVEALSKLIVESPARNADGTRCAWTEKHEAKLANVKSIRLVAEPQ
ncbi:MAG TPA: hypothetical protein VFM96_10140 [Gaiellaceae bacterium]|nr:hypothetical protein [Gaiellaceae bacterium]